VLLVVCSCSKGNERVASSDAKSTNLTAEELTTITSRRVLFGHQSVGENVLEGLRGVIEERSAHWPVAELESGFPAEAPTLVHTYVGENGNPRSKVDAFVRKLDMMAAAPPDVALMKLCYVDFAPDTDVPALFAYYRDTFTQVVASHPRTLIAHATVPLQARGTGLKSAVKRWLGKSTWTDAANLKREEFNALLRAEYRDAALFDIASAESTRADGAREVFVSGGKTGYALAAEYSSDGGHLNPVGQRHVAMEFLLFLRGAVRRLPAEGHAP